MQSYTVTKGVVAIHLFWVNEQISQQSGWFSMLIRLFVWLLQEKSNNTGRT